MRILDRPRVALKWATPDAEREIEAAGRVCWESWGRSDGTALSASEFIKRLKKVGHIDVLEEAELSVWIECSRTCSHQIVRHRTQHHLQASQRYIKADEPELLIPPKINADEDARKAFLVGMENAWGLYGDLRNMGIRAEDARFVLPGAALTKLKAKANLANWRKFISLRSDSAAQWEIRMLSNSILEICNQIAPSVFDDQVETFLTYNPLYGDIVDRSEFDNAHEWTNIDA